MDSAILRLTRRADPLIALADERRRFFRMCDGLFAHRRKQAPNSLARAGALGLGHAQWEAALGRAGIDARRRGETLTLEEAVGLFRAAEGLRDSS